MIKCYSSILELEVSCLDPSRSLAHVKRSHADCKIGIFLRDHGCNIQLEGVDAGAHHINREWNIAAIHLYSNNPGIPIDMCRIAILFTVTPSAPLLNLKSIHYTCMALYPSAIFMDEATTQFCVHRSSHNAAWISQQPYPLTALLI